MHSSFQFQKWLSILAMFCYAARLAFDFGKSLGNKNQSRSQVATHAKLYCESSFSAYSIYRSQRRNSWAMVSSLLASYSVVSEQHLMLFHS